VVVILAAHAHVFAALQTRATTEAIHTVVGDVVVAVLAIIVVAVVVTAADVEGMFSCRWWRVDAAIGWVSGVVSIMSAKMVLIKVVET
jgi:hypothetical protein